MNERESSIELLRMLMMLFILMHHLIVHALCPSVITSDCTFSPEYATYSVLEGFFYVGVNVFILISGYFGIKLRARKLWSLYLQCAFYGLLTYIFGVVMSTVPIQPHTFVTKSVFVFSHASSWWFVACYLMLMIVSPLLNYGIQMMNQKHYLFSLMCMTFLLVYLGWFWQKPIYDANGYSLINFIYVYAIGGYLHRYVHFDNIKQCRILALGMYVTCALIFGVCNILRLYIESPFGNLWGYNNPIMILGAVGLFLFVRTFKFQSNFVNYIGGGVLAAYLLTDIGCVGEVLYTAFLEFAQTTSSLSLHVTMLFAVGIILLLLACCVDLLRTRIMKPIIGAFDWLDRRWMNE